MIYLARIQRGKPHPRIQDEQGLSIRNINVTSGSLNKINGYPVKNLSPMLLGPVNSSTWELCRGESAQVMENYWQYGKLFPEMSQPHLLQETTSTKKLTPTPAWYHWRSKGYAETKGHRHPRGTKTNQVMRIDEKGRRWFRYRTAISSCYLLQTDEGEQWCQMGYLESRKTVYVPLYEALIQQQPAFQELRKQVQRGGKFVILDYDAPETPERVTLEFLREAVNQTSPYGKPFGHGYVLAGALLGLHTQDYLSDES